MQPTTNSQFIASNLQNAWSIIHYYSTAIHNINTGGVLSNLYLKKTDTSFGEDNLFVIL